jgi:hypothetical protein
MVESSPLQQSRASFYCGSFAKNDARIERALSAVEAAVQRRLSHYFHRTGKPKAIPGDRTAFVSQWLPGIQEKFGSQLLCPKTPGEHVLLVSLDNILSLPELVGPRGVPCNGALNVTFSAAAPFAKRIITHFAELIAATQCFHAFLRVSPLQRQQYFTRQNFTARVAEVERFRARSEALWKVNQDFLMKEADQYVYDIEEKPLTGVTPDGKTFALRLHWLNYWNNATAARLRFPDEKLDGPLQALYERLPGGWFVKLTPEPTDLDKPGDRERLQWAYERFAGPLGERGTR